MKNSSLGFVFAVLAVWSLLGPFLFSPLYVNVHQELQLLLCALILIPSIVLIRKSGIALGPSSSYEYVALGFLLFSAISIMWAHNLGLALFHLCGLSVALVFYFAVKAVVQRKGAVPDMRLLCNLVSVTSILVLLHSLWAVWKLKEKLASLDIAFSLDNTYLHLMKNVMGHKNPLSIYCLFLISLLLLKEKGVDQRRVLLKRVLILLLIVLVLLLQSRSATIGLVLILMAAAAPWLIEQMKQRFNLNAKVAIGLLVSGTFTVLASLFVILSQFSSKFNFVEMLVGGSDYGRKEMWQSSLLLAKQRLLNGFGLRSWPLRFPDAGLITVKEGYTHPHNDYLLYLFELGIPGLVILLLGIGVFFHYFIRARSFENREILLGFLAAIVASAAFINISLNISLTLFVAFAAAILAGSAAKKSEQRDGIVQPVLSGEGKELIWPGIFAAMMLITILVSVDHIRGDRAVRNTYYHLQKNDFPKVITSAEKIESPIFNLWHLKPASFYRGQAYYRERKYEQARVHYEQAVQENPNHSRVRFELGMIYRQTGKKRKALEQFEKTRQLDRNSYRNNAELAVTLLDLGRFKRAEEIAKELPDEVGRKKVILERARRRDRD